MVGGLTFGAIAAGYELVSLGASGISIGANFFAKRYDKVAVGAFGVAVGAGAGLASHAVPPAVQLFRNATGQVIAQAANSACKGY